MRKSPAPCKSRATHCRKEAKRFSCQSLERGIGIVRISASYFTSIYAHEYFNKY